MVIVGHHLSSDLTMLVRNGHQIPDGEYWDTYVAAKWCWPDLPQDGSYQLEHLALRMTTMPQWRETLGKQGIDSFDAMSDEVLAQRCGGDAEAPVRLKAILAPEIARLKLTKIWNMAMATLPILADIGGRGMHVDRKALFTRASTDDAEGVGTWLVKEKAQLEADLGIDNLSSRQQVAEALYETHGARPLYRTKSGEWSVDRLSLYWARKEAGGGPVTSLLDRLLEFGTKSKLQSTYYLPWSQDLSTTDRIHSIYTLGTTATGRLSSYDHNLQNLPEPVRELVKPSPGYDYIVSADHGMLELRSLAEITRDATLGSWIREGKDVHSLMAARVIGLPEPTNQAEFARFKEEHHQARQAGKKANFATVYGVGAESLAYQLFLESDGAIWVPPNEMQKYIDTIHATWKGFTSWSQELWYKLHRNEWIMSPLGRRWQLPADKAGWRKARNYPVQSMASDVTLLGLRALWQTLRTYGWKSRIIGEVHDSIILETTKHELASLVHLIKEKLEHPDLRSFGLTLQIPLVVDVKAGPTLAALDAV